MLRLPPPPRAGAGIQGDNSNRYRCGHNLLIAHGMAAALYREKYAPRYGGRISMALSGHWGLPLNASSPAGAGAPQQRDKRSAWRRAAGRGTRAVCGVPCGGGV